MNNIVNPNLTSMKELKACFWDLYNLYVKKELNDMEKGEVSDLGKRVLDIHFNTEIENAP